MRNGFGRSQHRLQVLGSFQENCGASEINRLIDMWYAMGYSHFIWRSGVHGIPLGLLPPRRWFADAPKKSSFAHAMPFTYLRNLELKSPTHQNIFTHMTWCMTVSWNCQRVSFFVKILQIYSPKFEQCHSLSFQTLIYTPGWREWWGTLEHVFFSRSIDWVKVFFHDSLGK